MFSLDLCILASTMKFMFSSSTITFWWLKICVLEFVWNELQQFSLNCVFLQTHVIELLRLKYSFFFLYINNCNWYIDCELWLNGWNWKIIFFINGCNWYYMDCDWTIEIEKFISLSIVVIDITWIMIEWLRLRDYFLYQWL